MLTGAGVEGISLAGDACGGALSPCDQEDSETVFALFYITTYYAV